MKKLHFLFAALFALVFACTSELEQVASKQSASPNAARVSSDSVPTIPIEACIDSTLIKRFAEANIQCPDENVPVIGCNGVTYPNFCEAQKAGVRFLKQVPPPTDSLPPTRPCIDSTLIKGNENLVCPAIYQPVIGCNGVVYSNECEAKRAGVLFVRPVEPKENPKK